MKNFIRQAARQFKSWRLRRLVKRQLGTAYPESVQLAGSPHRLYVDPKDRRAYNILIAGPLRNRIPRVQPFWREACAQTAPSMALDVGVNYGECLFGPSYSPSTEVHGFEANPALIRFIERSRHEHPDGSRIHVHLGLMAEQPGPAATFYIDREWSGGSSAVAGLRPTEPGRFEALTVPVSSVDVTLGERPGQFGSLVFKIDVEGYEFRVLQGMTKILAAATWSVGLLEFDPKLMRAAGDDLDQYWEFLSSRFRIYAFDGGLIAREVSREWWADITNSSKGDVHTDLIVVGGEPNAAVDRFLAQWTMTRAMSRAA